MGKLWFWVLVWGLPGAIRAQSFSLNSLFQPGLRTGSGLVASGGDTVGLGFGSVQVGGVAPVFGKLKLNIEDLEVSGHQTFFTATLGHRFVWSALPGTPSLSHALLGATHLRAGLRSGIWLYTLNLGVFGSGSRAIPLGFASAVRVQVRGLRKQNFFGLALVGVGGQVLPLPVLGLNRRLSRNWDLRMLVPTALTVARSMGSRHSMEIKLSGQFFQIPAPQEVWRYRQLQFSAGWRIKSRIWRLSAEAGIAFARNLKIGSFDQDLAPAPYASLVFNYNLGESKIGSQLFYAQ